MLDRSILELDISLPFEERQATFEKIYSRFENEIEKYWEEYKTKVFIEILSNYLYPKEKGNRSELSVTKHREIIKGTRYTVFSNLDNAARAWLGIENKQVELEKHPCEL